MQREAGAARRREFEDRPGVIHRGDAAEPGEAGGEFVPEAAAARHAEQGLRDEIPVLDGQALRVAGLVLECLGAQGVERGGQDGRGRRGPDHARVAADADVAGDHAAGGVDQQALGLGAAAIHADLVAHDRRGGLRLAGG